MEEDIELITVVNSEGYWGKAIEGASQLCHFQKKKLSDLVSWKSCKKIEGEKFL